MFNCKKGMQQPAFLVKNKCVKDNESKKLQRYFAE